MTNDQRLENVRKFDRNDSNSDIVREAKLSLKSLDASN